MVIDECNAAVAALLPGVDMSFLPAGVGGMWNGVHGRYMVDGSIDRLIDGMMMYTLYTSIHYIYSMLLALYKFTVKFVCSGLRVRTTQGFSG